MSGDELRLLAEEQAALRRVATLVAHGAAPEEMFAAVVKEVGQLLPVDFADMGRYEPDGTITFVASWGDEVARFPVGSRWTLEGNNLVTIVSEMGRPARNDSYANSTGPVGVAARERGARSAAATPIVVEGRVWGVIRAGCAREEPLPDDFESRLASFTELLATGVANVESRAGLARLAAEQAALRRVATLVARGMPQEKLFAAVVEEVGRLLALDFADMGRYRPDGTVGSVASWGRANEHFPIGMRKRLGGKNLSTIVAETGCSARIEDYREASGSIGVAVQASGFRSGVGTPITVEGRLWGLMVAGSTHEQPMPADTESRLTSFTELLGTAIANAESRAGLARLAEEQAALRRVATLVARGAAPEKVFAAVTEEVGQLLAVDYAHLARYEPDGAITILAGAGRGFEDFAGGQRWSLGGEDVATIVLETGRPARVDSFADASGPLGVAAREERVGSGVGTPVIVEGHLWGVMATHSPLEQPLPVDTEARLANFTELVATAIANAESRAALAASRARIVAAADQARRRIERDLHDGTQQQLVSLMLELQATSAAEHPEAGELTAQLARTKRGLGGVLEELREISHGIHPGILSRGGLRPALGALAGRSAVPVELDLGADRRLPENIEVAAYYVVSEALTNSAKHSQASSVRVELIMRETVLRLAIRDDGIGGADPGKGSGLVGLTDRVEALGGTLEVTSPAGGGTTLLIEIPLRAQDSAISPVPPRPGN